MKTFPDYLIIHMKKFAYDETFTPKKLDVFLDVPNILDLEYLRATGLQPGEKLLPEDDTDSTAAAASAGSFEFNEGFLAQLKDMGFDENGCRRALFQTKNAGVEPAMNWIFEHMSDPDFATAFEVPKPDGSGIQPILEVDPEALAYLLSMGMDERAARLGLKLNVRCIERIVVSLLMTLLLIFLYRTTIPNKLLVGFSTMPQTWTLLSDKKKNVPKQLLPPELPLFVGSIEMDLQNMNSLQWCPTWANRHFAATTLLTFARRSIRTHTFLIQRLKNLLKQKAIQRLFRRKVNHRLLSHMTNHLRMLVRQNGSFLMITKLT